MYMKMDELPVVWEAECMRCVQFWFKVSTSKVYESTTEESGNAGSIVWKRYNQIRRMGDV